MAKKETPTDTLEEGDLEGPQPQEADDKVPGVDLETALSEERERYLRLAAEFDNFRKRTERDMTEWRRRAKDDLLLSMLDVLDNLDRALESASDSDPGDLLEGLKAIRVQMAGVLSREGFEPIESVGRPFDPFEMEAVMRMPSEEVEEGGVVRELLKGYKGQGYILRHSKVIVSSGPQGPESERNDIEAKQRK